MLSSKYRKIARELTGEKKAKKEHVEPGSSQVMYIGYGIT